MYRNQAPRPARRALSSLAGMALLLVCPVVAAGSQTAPTLERSTVRADDGETLVVWTKRPARTAVGAILLLHGRTWSALPNFDLHVAAHSLSTMDALVASGYAVYALDQRGYGATHRDSSGWLTPDRAAHDVADVLDWIDAREQRLSGHRGDRPALLGYSRGSMTALLVAQRYPDKLSRVIAYGFPYDPKALPVAGADSTSPPRSPPRVRTTLSAAGEDFTIAESPGAAVKDAYMHAAVRADSIRVDWTSEGEFGVLDPGRIRVPILFLNGERDPYVRRSVTPEFFAHLGAVDRTWTVLANADHVAHLERPGAFVRAVTGFLGRSRD